MTEDVRFTQEIYQRLGIYEDQETAIEIEGTFQEWVKRQKS